MKNTLLLKLCKYDWFPRLIRPIIKPVKPKQWVFILGCYNSGTTLLDHLLSQHSEISNLPTEGVMLTHGLPSPEKYGWPRLWYKCIDTIEYDFKNSGVTPGTVIKDWSLWYKRHAPVVVEKSIANSMRINWLNKHFNNPFFIWIIRNGYCVAEGIRRRSAVSKTIPSDYHENGYPIEWCAKQWVESNNLINKNITLLNNVLFLKYEDLVADPYQTLTKVYKYLCVDDKKVPKIKSIYFPWVSA